MMTLDQIKTELAHYSLAKVARASGVDKASIYRMMKEGSKPSYDIVKKLSDYLGGAEE